MSPYDLRRYHPLAVAMIVGIPLVAIGLIVWDLSRGGSAREPTDVGSTVVVLDVCPSEKIEDWRHAAEVLHARYGLHTEVTDSACDGPPIRNEAQARSYTDQVDPYRRELPDGWQAITASVGQPVESAVIYVDRTKSTPCTYVHELLHVHGLGIAVDGKDGHASSGILSAECGIGWALVDAVIARRAAP